MSKTPITDEASHGFIEKYGRDIWDIACVDAEVARRLESDRAELIEALRNAVEIIRTWHNMGGCEDVWDIYYENAPEMKQIRALLARLEGK